MRTICRHAILAFAAIVIAAPAYGKALPSNVLLGENGAVIARTLTNGRTCPKIAIDGNKKRMSLRVPPETLPLRPTQSAPKYSKPSVFPVSVCETVVPDAARYVSVDGQSLPIPPHQINRIVVIGDTGCRLKASDKAYQACNDPSRYPFAEIAAHAAAWKPDIVIHVGDYLYRENPCPKYYRGCEGSPWGYGWDSWQADFFAPGKILLHSAPFIFVRGNHEDCIRAGQGWWRFLDPHPFVQGRDCNDPRQDVANDYSRPFRVPLGGGAQVVVLDLAFAPYKALASSDPRSAQLDDAYGMLDKFAKDASFTFVATHKPILGFATDSSGQTLFPGNQAIQHAFAAYNPMLLPRGVIVLLAGHVHLWEQVSFSTPYPTQFVAGFSGTEEEPVPLAAILPANASHAPGVVVKRFSSWSDGFGYMTLERQGSNHWLATVWDRHGVPVNRCQIRGRRSRCARSYIW
ncbi:MAG: metallophosphoesterase [Alphaproteobacteria bacterium]|nr:metallophosphoesterase [Alphaproteobacteria bacterium]